MFFRSGWGLQDMKSLVRPAIRLLRAKKRRTDALIRQADSARDAGAYVDAAVLYEEALQCTPRRTDIRIQAAHMHKEARNFDAAARAYEEARRLRPNDADLALQLGHFAKAVGRMSLAEAEYRRAAALAPGWMEPVRELEVLERVAADLAPSACADVVPAWELVPGPPAPPRSGVLDRIVFRRFGARQVSIPEGRFPLLSGVEAIRGICFSDRALEQAVLLIDGVAIHHEAISSHQVDGPVPWKAVFNLWVDLSAVEPGIHRLDLVLADASGWTCRVAERVLIAHPLPEYDTLIASDAIFDPIPSDPRGIEAQVRARPSMVRSAGALRPPPPERILVVRTDQLGDMVVSVPALRRLRALFPAARIVGLLTAANADLARSLALFDEVIEADVPDDPLRRQRTMLPEHQRALAQRLASERFDVAIDLATSGASRPLLKLAHARSTFGFDDDASPWLTGGISGSVRDPHGGGEASPQSSRVLALVERLGTLFGPPAAVIWRADIDLDVLADFGLRPGERFVVLHAGARVAWSRWPGFIDLARAILERHALRVVLLTEGTELERHVPSELCRSNQLIVIDHRLAFDTFDTLLSSATAFVGNDSGPKHLAALRGTPVVSIHCARIGWAEWGQEQTGVIVSRQVPCAGCAIFHDADECGKGFACVTDIGVDEVLAALDTVLRGEA